ncbi:MAG: hypothetical protein FD171_680 [Actinobacteria bacterium]|nr:MAG: hypothetical protein FD171_680 [Actinomycetota bacterium]
MLEQHERTLEECHAEFERLAHNAYRDIQLAGLVNIALLGMIFITSLAIALK